MISLRSNPRCVGLIGFATSFICVSQVVESTASRAGWYVSFKRDRPAGAVPGACRTPHAALFAYYAALAALFFHFPLLFPLIGILSSAPLGELQTIKDV